jgi:hypothetical protein
MKIEELEKAISIITSYATTYPETSTIAKDMRTALKPLEEYRNQGREGWISVKEKLPKPDNQWIYIHYVRPDGSHGVSEMIAANLENVLSYVPGILHWQYKIVPEPPQS